MNKLSLFAIIFTLTFGAMYLVDRYTPKSTVPSPTPSTPSVEPAPCPLLSMQESVGSIQAESIKKDLHYLASKELEGRMSGKKGHFKAVDYLEEKCKALGLSTERQRFKIRRLNPGPHNEQGEDWTENLFAWIEGNDPILKDEIVVVGAHSDHIGHGPSMAKDNVIGVHPGADDNASGSVALIAIAEAIAKMGPQPRTIVFQWYSAEEMGLIGSRFYCNNPTFPKSGPDIRKHVAMINMDMIGRLGTGYYNVSFYHGNSSIDLGKFIDELDRTYRFAKKITSRGGGGSDHASFYNKKVPVCFLHTGLHADYHKVTDTPDKINYDGIERIAKYATELTYKIANANARPQFNHAEFKEMEYTHDHGHGGVEFIHPWHLKEWREHHHHHDGHSHPH